MGTENPELNNRDRIEKMSRKFSEELHAEMSKMYSMIGSLDKKMSIFIESMSDYSEVKSQVYKNKDNIRDLMDVRSVEKTVQVLEERIKKIEEDVDPLKYFWKFLGGSLAALATVAGLVFAALRLFMN